VHAAVILLGLLLFGVLLTAAAVIRHGSTVTRAGMPPKQQPPVAPALTAVQAERLDRPTPRELPR
jgi:hypothetical protein